MKIPSKEKIIPYLPCILGCLFILSATFIRWMNYFSMLWLVAILFHIFQTRTITKSVIDLIWAAFILIYPLMDAGIRGGSGLDLFTILCYLVPCVFLLSADYTVDNCVKPFLDFFKFFALFQASGIYLSMIWNGLYLRIAYKLITKISTNLKGFASDATVAAYFLCIGAGIFWFEARKYEKINRTVLKDLACVLILFVALVSTTKRSFLLIFVFSIILIEVISAINQPKKLISILVVSIISIAAVLLICYVCHSLGQSNALSRLWDTLVGIQNDEDVSSMRSTWAEYMAEWGKDNPIFGIGWESFPIRLRDTPYAGEVPNGHNVYKQILCEEGYIGFCFYLLLILASCTYGIYLVLRKQKENSRELSTMAKCVCFMIVVYSAYCYFGNAIYDTVIYVPFFYSLKMLYQIKCSHPVTSVIVDRKFISS